MRIEPSRGGDTFQDLEVLETSFWKRDVVSVVTRGREATKRTSGWHCASLNLSKSPLAVPVLLAYNPLNIDRVHQHDVNSFAVPPHSLRMVVS